MKFRRNKSIKIKLLIVALLLIWCGSGFIYNFFIADDHELASAWILSFAVIFIGFKYM